MTQLLMTRLKSRNSARRRPKATRELIVDSFAGGGGASLGIEAALGRPVDIAINHDPDAIDMHQTNHPGCRHLTEDLWKIDPHKATRSQAVGLLWASPDCTHFSRAKGGKPAVKKHIRSLAWIVVKWAKEKRPRVIMLENVREFQDWGPLVQMEDTDGTALGANPTRVVRWMPCPKRKGLTFKRWVAELRRLGYVVEWKVLNASEYGAPTHRRRLFLIARCDGKPIVWPEPTHGPGRIPYRTAAECIDWSIPCPSIFLSAKEGKQLGVIRPLADKTMRRIAMGLKRYVLDNPKPFRGDSHGTPATDPLPTITAGAGSARPAGAAHALGMAAVHLTRFYGNSVGQESDKPAPTQCEQGHTGIVAAHLTQYFGGMVGKPLTEPVPTVTSIDHNGVVAAHLVQYNQEKTENCVRGQRADAPVNTIPTENRFSLVAANLVHLNHGQKQCSGVDEPNRAVTAQGNHAAIVTAWLLKNNAGSFGQSPEDPLHTVTTGGRFAAVYAWLMKYFGTAVGQPCDDPLHTVTGKDRFGVVTVTVEGQRYVIADVGMRMLTPRELARAQGFPDDYELTGSKANQVAKIGNSVCPVMAEVLVRANYVEAS